MEEKSSKSTRVDESHTGGPIKRMAQRQGEKSLAHFMAAERNLQEVKDATPNPTSVIRVKHHHEKKEMTDAMRGQMTKLLMEVISKCSRQKMRFILMNLRRISGIDSYMTFAELTKTLQEHGIVIPPMASNMLQTSCSDQLGVDSEKVWKLLMEVHSESDRDSVRARKGLHLRTPMISVFADHGGDRELLEKVESQLLSAVQSNFDFNSFKSAVLELDKSHRGYVANTQLLKICREHSFPVTGECLKALLIRSDDDNNGKTSHREFFIFVDKAFNNALKVNPKLFAKKEEDKNKKRNADAGRLLEDGVVTINQKNRLKVKKAERGSANLGGSDLEGTSATEIGGPYRSGSNLDLNNSDVPENMRRESVTSTLVMSASEDGKQKGKRMGKMMGLLGRKKGGATSTTLDVQDANSDAMSMVSSTYSSVSRAGGSVNRELSANGLLEKTIRPVVRKVNDHKIVLWPPDEYFDAITPKTRTPQLEWVYGYSGFSNRNNIFLLNGGNRLLYFTGYIVVIYDLNSESQRSYNEHDGKIQCASISKDGKVAATGQSSEGETVLAAVRVWNTENLQTIHTFKTELSGVLSEAVVAVTFSKEDDAIIAIDSAKPRNLSVWSLEIGQMLASKPCTESPVVCGIIALQAQSKDHHFILYGRNVMEVWRIVPIEKKIDFIRQCVFGQIPKPAIITCLTEISFGENASLQVLSGDSDGNVILWGDEMRPKIILQTGNKVPVFTVCALSVNQILSGSRDGTLCVMTCASEIAIVTHRTKIPEQYGGIRMIVPGSQTDPLSLFIGTTANCLLHLISTLPAHELDVEKVTLSLLTAGHFDENTGCLCTFVDEKRALALTAAMDGNINCYDLQNHKTLWRLFLKDSMISAVDAYMPYIAVGTADAKLKLFQMTYPEPTQLLQAKVGKGKVTCLKFSPDGTRLAVGSEESEVYLYKISDGEVGLSPIGKFDKHDHPVSSMDWSKNPARDNHFIIHSNSNQLENFLFDAESMDFLEEAHFFRNIKWASQNCVFGFAALTSATVEGSLDGQIICTDVSPTLDLVAVVTSAKKNVVGLYSFPNANVQPVNHFQPTASSGISAVRFCYVNNQLYIVCAHNNGNLTQWSLR